MELPKTVIENKILRSTKPEDFADIPVLETSYGEYYFAQLRKLVEEKGDWPALLNADLGE